MDFVAQLTKQGIIEVKDVVQETSVVFGNLLKSSVTYKPIKPKTFQYSSTPGGRDKLDVYYPPTPQTGKTPIVFWVYGGGFVTGARVLEPPLDATYTNVGTYFANQGFVTVVPDYRLACEPWFAQYPKPVQDIRDAVTWIVSHPDELKSSTTPNPDTNSLFLIGHSAGGTHVGTLTFESEVLPLHSSVRSCIKGVILIAGLYYNDPKSQFEEEMKLYYGEKLDSHSVMSLLKSSKTEDRALFPKIYLAEAQHEPEAFKTIRKNFQKELETFLGVPVPFLEAEKHNHVSVPTGLCSGQDEEWAAEVSKWIRENL